MLAAITRFISSIPTSEEEGRAKNRAAQCFWSSYSRDNDRTMRSHEWNHNIHYHDEVLRSISSCRGRALDVGSGNGSLARRLARHFENVVAIDVDHDVLVRAQTMSAGEARIEFVESDVNTQSFCNNSFDLVVAVATLHHLPLRLALERFRDLLKPGGVLSIIGAWLIERLRLWQATWRCYNLLTPSIYRMLPI
jgi:2-polyprenyl-3-methyl-5-hydroxy-6-metoxy-1,4-benzoquinol methylase